MIYQDRTSPSLLAVTAGEFLYTIPLQPAEAFNTYSLKKKEGFGAQLSGVSLLSLFLLTEKTWRGLFISL